MRVLALYIYPYPFLTPKDQSIAMKLTLKPGIIHRKITWLLLFSIFSLALVGCLIYRSEQNIQRTNQRINQTYEIIGKAQQIITSVVQSGSDAYRYMENGDGGAALLLRSSRGKLEQDLNILQQLSRDNNDQVQHMQLLHHSILQKRSFEDSLYQRSSALPPDKERIAATNHIADYNNAIINLVSSIIREEEGLLATRKHLNETAIRWTAYAMGAGRLASFLFVVIIVMQLNKDITRRRKIQEQLVGAIREAEEAKQMQEQFLANMSHEIRTPMNGIKGMTDLLLDTPLSVKQHELTGIIKSSVNNLLVIINDILDFSKIKAGKLNIEKIEFKLRDVLGSAGVLFDHRMKKKGLHLRTDVDGDIPDRLIGDPHRLNQVLTNLLGNAIKFTDEGHIHIRVSLQKKSAEEVVLSFNITDTGIGIPEGNLPYIFDSFSQAGEDISRRYGGTGLGLTICKQLLHLQGGDITATSMAGAGSVFSFYLPYRYNATPDAERPAAEVIYDYSNLLAGKRFLVAEDNEINQKLIDYVLRKAGGSVELVNNGAEAIRYLQQDTIVDLIIMDLQMPEMDGYVATRFIRNDLHMDTPIIAMTATAMKGEHLQCLESGMNEYMTKPFEFAELYKRISGLLSYAPAC